MKHILPIIGVVVAALAAFAVYYFFFAGYSGDPDIHGNEGYLTQVALLFDGKWQDSIGNVSFASGDKVGQVKLVRITAKAKNEEGEKLVKLFPGARTLTGDEGVFSGTNKDGDDAIKVTVVWKKAAVPGQGGSLIIDGKEYKFAPALPAP